MVEKGRAKQLLKQWEDQQESLGKGTGDKPPKRVRSYLTYLGDDRIVEIPFTTPGDILAAEETLGPQSRLESGEPLPYVRLQWQSKTNFWIIWRALGRHPDEAERPQTEFEVWRETVDQIWDDRGEPPPLAELEARSQPPLSSDG